MLFLIFLIQSVPRLNNPVRTLLMDYNVPKFVKKLDVVYLTKTFPINNERMVLLKKTTLYSMGVSHKFISYIPNLFINGSH